MSTSPAAVPESSLAGEMARRVATHDWASTPLGPRARWPQALRIAVDICLGSRFPMFVWWGPQFVNIYNDAYVPILGGKHPQALGRPARTAWGEIWDVVGPQAEMVMREGGATWNERVLLVMERRGYREDTWFTWSYSPIRDEAGRVGGMFCACVEETPRVVVERERDQLLAEAERERLRLFEAFSQAPTFLAILEGPEHVYRFANERYFELVGERELVGKRLRDALPEIAEQGYTDILDGVYRTGSTHIGEGVKVLLRRQADLPLEARYVDFAFTPLVSRGGVEGIVVAGADVTARVLGEERDRFLLALEDALRPLGEPLAIVQTAARLLAEHLLVDRCTFSDVHEDGRFTVLGDFARGVPSVSGTFHYDAFGSGILPTLRAGRSYVAEDVRALGHGPDVLRAFESLPLRALVEVPLLKGGRLVAAMGAHQVEPRSWTPAEVELVEHASSRCYESIERARVERTLRESEARFRQLADAMPQMVFATDAAGRVVYFNRQWHEYTGMAPGDTREESWHGVFRPEDLEAMDRDWPRARDSGQPYETEYALRRHDGAWRWHLGRVVPVRDERGAIVRWYGTNTDIDDRKRMEERLGEALAAEQHARGAAEQASRMKDEFLATLSHELRTPLNAILGWAHVMRREGATPPQLSQGAAVIERNARAQAKIIEDLLDMSAIISGKVRLEMAAVDLPALVAGAVETARPTAEAKGVALEALVDPLWGMRVDGDAHRLQQVLWNLLSNAIKFTPGGGSVVVTLRAREGRAELAVSDTGEGIAEPFLPFVFDRFRQADASTTRRHGGLGLGLSIVKQLAEMHGGAVAVKSPGPGRGTTFMVALPMRPEEPTVPTHAPERRRSDEPVAPEAPPGEAQRLAGIEVLVVDDDRDARELVARLLEDCEARVTLAASADEALQALGGRRFDVLVSDIGMPGQDGYALIRRVRELPTDGNGAIPAMALTAYARGEDRVKAMRAGFQMHAAKPVEPAELVAIVASLARRY